MFHQIGIHRTLTAEDIRYRRHVLRVEIDARILANQPQQDIATRMKLPLEVVGEYELRFFNIRESLSSPDRVWGLIIDGNPGQILHPGDVIRFWQGIGYLHGISTLEPFLAPAHRSTLSKQGLMAYLRRDAQLSLDLKLLVARACCARLRTEQGLESAREIAARGDWRAVLRVSKATSTVFGRVVSLFRKEIEEKERRANRRQNDVARRSSIWTVRGETASGLP